MNNVEFNEDQGYAPEDLQKPPAVEGLVMRLGLAKDRKGAQKVLIGAVVILVVAAGAVFAMSGPQTFDSDEFPEGYLNNPNFNN